MDKPIGVKVVQPATTNEESGEQMTLFGSPVVHGGPGSGNFGHSGRPGERGGSGGGGGGSSLADRVRSGAIEKEIADKDQARKNKIAARKQGVVDRKAADKQKTLDLVKKEGIDELVRKEAGKLSTPRSREVTKASPKQIAAASDTLAKSQAAMKERAALVKEMDNFAKAVQSTAKESAAARKSGDNETANMLARDAEALDTIRGFAQRGEWKDAMAVADKLDTAAREQIPGKVWKMMVKGSGAS